jgi:hypothetical protein
MNDTKNTHEYFNDENVAPNTTMPMTPCKSVNGDVKGNNVNDAFDDLLFGGDLSSARSSMCAPSSPLSSIADWSDDECKRQPRRKMVP